MEKLHQRTTLKQIVTVLLLQSKATKSIDTTEQLMDSDFDPEYTIFPILFAKVDNVCVILNGLIQW